MPMKQTLHLGQELHQIQLKQSKQKAIDNRGLSYGQKAPK